MTLLGGDGLCSIDGVTFLVGDAPCSIDGVTFLVEDAPCSIDSITFLVGDTSRSIRGASFPIFSGGLHDCRSVCFNWKRVFLREQHQLS